MLTGSPLLSLLLLPLLAFADTGSSDPPGDDAPEEEEGEQDDEEEEEDQDGDEEEIRDPQAKIKALEGQVDRLSKKLKGKDERIGQLEAGGDQSGQLQESRLEAAFLRAVLAREEPIADLETAWDLANVRGFLDPVKVEEDGAVEGMAEALDRLVERYPYLAAENDGDDEEEAPKSGGRPVANSPRKQDGDSTLRSRFPALRGRRRFR